MSLVYIPIKWPFMQRSEIVTTIKKFETELRENLSSQTG